MIYLIRGGWRRWPSHRTHPKSQSHEWKSLNHLHYGASIDTSLFSISFDPTSLSVKPTRHYMSTFARASDSSSSSEHGWRRQVRTLLLAETSSLYFLSPSSHLSLDASFVINLSTLKPIASRFFFPCHSMLPHFRSRFSLCDSPRASPFTTSILRWHGIKPSSMNNAFLVSSYGARRWEFRSSRCAMSIQ